MAIKLEHRAEALLSSVLAGKSLREWVNARVARLLHKSNQSAPPFRVDDDDLLSLLMVNRISAQRRLAERARLLIMQNGFEIQFRPHRSPHTLWNRYRIAHEMAHIFFYDIRRWPPPSLVILKAGDKALEWTCDLIARSLLLPAEWVDDTLPDVGLSGNLNRQVESLARISSIFEVPYSVAVKRLVSDLETLNLVFVRFIRTADLKGPSVSDAYRWRVLSHEKPRALDELLYIPWGRTIGNQRILPKCTGPLRDFLEGAERDTQGVRYYKTSVDLNFFKSKSMGNLAKCLELKSGTERVSVLFDFVGESTVDLFASDDTFKPLQTCDLYILHE